MALNPNQKKMLLIGGALLVLLIIVIIVAVAMKKKSAQEHSADAQDAANMAVMHAKIAQAAASSPDNSAKNSTVETAVDASKQASAQSADSASKAAASGVSTNPVQKVTVNNNPSASGNFYIQYQSSGSVAYLKSDGSMVADINSATLFSWNSTSNILIPDIAGNTFQATPTEYGIILTLYGQSDQMVCYTLTSTIGGTQMNGASITSAQQPENCYVNFVTLN